MYDVSNSNGHIFITLIFVINAKRTILLLAKLIFDNKCCFSAIFFSLLKEKFALRCDVLFASD